MNYSEISSALSDAGIDVALPGARQGICLAPYVVIQQTGTYRFALSDGLGYSLITVHCYVPLGSYPLLSPLIERVRAALLPLRPDIRPAGSESPHIINDHFRAHEGSVQYIALKRLY